MGFFKKLVKGIGRGLKKGAKGLGRGIKKIASSGVGKILGAGISIASSFIPGGSFATGFVGKLMKGKLVSKATKFGSKLVKSNVGRGFAMSKAAFIKLRVRPSAYSKKVPALPVINKRLTTIQAAVFGRRPSVIKTAKRPPRKAAPSRQLTNFNVSTKPFGDKKPTRRRIAFKAPKIGAKPLTSTSAAPPMDTAKKLGIAASIVGISVGIFSLLK